MSNSAKTMHYFSFYLFLTGITLLVAPNFLLKTFGLPTTGEVWIRVVGMLAFFIGVYYYFSAKYEVRQIFRVSVFARLSVPLFFGTFVLLGWTQWPLLLFAGVDVAGAIWTHLALKNEAA